ncbi:MAG TPA: site-2 protease family protein [Gammaproteobacteria bacterium]|nr:site-2 protease family protein [Gammaproteobacteria bacterium]
MELTVIQKIAIWAIPILFAITLHEVAHGWVASFFGDQTARLTGRLTINPVKHIDVMGTLVVPILMLVFGGFIFGWAKPVPVDARNMRHPRYNMVIVAMAGPIANLLMAVFWALIAKIGLNLNAWFGVPLVYMGQAGMMINIVLGVLNCLPIPPLDGGRALCNLLPGQLGWSLHRLEPYGFLIIVLLMLSGILSSVIEPVISFVMRWLMVLFNLT